VPGLRYKKGLFERGVAIIEFYNRISSGQLSIAFSIIKYNNNGDRIINKKECIRKWIQFN
jgi:hypothetical protein